MSNSLIPKELSQGGSLSKHSLSDISASKGITYLPRLQLFGGKSNACNEGIIGIGRYGVVRNKQITDIGNEVEAVFVCFRAKAFSMSDEIITNFDPDSDIYKDIEERSYKRDSGCTFGPELLLYIPEQRCFATFHMNSVSARREAENLEALEGCPIFMTIEFVNPSTSKYSWHVPRVVGSSTPLDLPPTEELKEVIANFLNPPAPEIEVDTDTNNTERET